MKKKNIRTKIKNKLISKKYIVIFLAILCCITGLLYTSFSHLNIKEKKVGIIYIATGKYILFWDKFYENAEQFFLPEHQKTYFVITDDTKKKLPENALKIYQEQLPWPKIVLSKYHFIDSLKDKLKDFEYIFLFNANLIPIKKVGKEILPTPKQKLVVQTHPGYFKTSTRPYDHNPKSTAYIPHGSGKYYFAGGFVGGFTKDFLELTQTIKKNIDIDNKNGIIALWHDESHLNRYILDWTTKGNTPLILTPLYMMPEEAIHTPSYRNLTEFKKNPKMILLDKSKKGHKWWRSM